MRLCPMRCGLPLAIVPIVDEDCLMDTSIFSGVIPALMTPCRADRTPDFDALVRKA